MKLVDMNIQFTVRTEALKAVVIESRSCTFLTSTFRQKTLPEVCLVWMSLHKEEEEGKKKKIQTVQTSACDAVSV